MASEPESPYVLQVDPQLVNHAKHLPETVECWCGFRREVGWLELP